MILRAKTTQPALELVVQYTPGQYKCCVNHMLSVGQIATTAGDDMLEEHRHAVTLRDGVLDKELC